MKIKLFQAGGQMAPDAMPAEQGTPAPEMQGQMGAEDQLMALSQQLVQMLLEQLQDPNAVLAVLEGAMQLLQESVSEAQPRFKKGGKLVKKAKKASCGAKMAK